MGQELARRIDSEMLLEWCKWSAVLEDRKYREVKSDGRRNFMGGNENSNKETGISIPTMIKFHSHKRIWKMMGDEIFILLRQY